MSRPVVVCANVILRGDDVLLVQETKPAALGRWSLPGGKLEAGESMAAGAAREALEETGLKVTVGDLVGIYHCEATLEGGASVIFVFASTVTGGHVQISSEHPQVEFFTPQQFEDVVARRVVRGQHVLPSVAAARQAKTLGTSLVTVVPASPPPMG